MVDIEKVLTVTLNGEECLDVYYPLPASDNKSHHHIIPLAAVTHRMAIYGCSTVEEAVEEIIHESLSTPDRDPDKHPSKADRLASKAKHGKLKGLKLDKTKFKDPTPDEETEKKIQHHWQAHNGRAGMARVRGVAAEDIPELIENEEGVKHLAKRLPKVIQDAPPHPKAPK